MCFTCRGDFAGKEVEVAFAESDRTGPGEGSWMYGRFERSGVDVVLAEKTGEE